MRATTSKIKKLLTFSFSLLTACAAFAQQQYTITNYTQENGLPSGTIRGIYKDTTGYLWLTSEEGVARFDGYHFKVFRHNPDISNSLPDNNTWHASFPQNGDIYFGTSLYNPVSESFTFNFPFGDTIKVFSVNESKGTNDCYWVTGKYSLFRVSKTGSERFALPCAIDPDLWFTRASPGNQVFLFREAKSDINILFLDYQTKKVLKIKILDRAGMQISSTITDLVYTGNNFYLVNTKSVYRFNAAAKSFVWQVDIKHTGNFSAGFAPFHPFNDSLFMIRTKSGSLDMLNFKTGEEKPVYLNKRIPEAKLNDRMILACVPDNQGGFWMGTSEMGIIRYNPVTGDLQQYIHEPGNSNSLPGNLVDFILPGDNGVIWASCFGHGLIKMEPVTPLIKTAVPAAANSTGNSGSGWSENIRCFLETDDGYWIATLHGMFSYSSRTNQFSNLQYLFPEDLVNKNAIDYQFGSLAKDHAGNLWVGTWYSELHIYNAKLNRSFKLRIPQPVRDRDNEIVFRNLFCDRKNRMWISTRAAGVWMVDCNALDFENINETKIEYNFFDEKDSSSVSAGTVFVVTEDAEGTIWAGTEKGLCRYNEQTKKWKRYYNIPGNENSIHHNNIRSLCLDKQGTLWIGTNGGGLNRYNKEQDNFTHFTMENGLVNDQIYTLVCDNNGMLWMGTNSGLCRFNPVDYSCANFTEKDGIQNYEFNTNAALKLKDGTLLFGGIAGYNIINPDKIENKKSPPPAVVISSFKIFDRETPTGDGHLKLNYKENSLAFEFAALSYYRNQENHYAYMLEGNDHEWIHSDTRRYVSYSKLEPGDYTFKVKASNADGVWNETGAQLQITITPPWWKTSWAKVLYLILITGSIVGYNRYRTHALLAKHKELESEVSKATIELRKKNDEVEKKNQELVTALENLKSAQEQLIQSEKLAAFGTMATRMAHEIQNPLNFVNNFSTISKQLVDEIKNEAATEKEKLEAMNLLNDNLESIYQHGKRAAVIIHQLQEHQRAGTTHEFFEGDET